MLYYGVGFSVLKNSKRCFRLPLMLTSCRQTQTQNTDDLELNDENALLEEEIGRKRNKNRLPEYVYKTHILKENPKLFMKYQFTEGLLKNYYGHYGESSGLNPGLMWPTKEELKHIKEFEEKYYRPLDEMLQNVQAEKEQLEKQKKEWEEQVDKNMANYPKVLNDYYAKIAKKEAQVEQLRKKREILVDEVCEYLGYEIDPRDPRFQEVVERKEAEKKKAEKQKKEKESYQKMLQKLSEIARDPSKIS